MVANNREKRIEKTAELVARPVRPKRLEDYEHSMVEQDKPASHMLMEIIRSEIGSVYRVVQSRQRLSRDDWHALLSMAKINAVNGIADRALASSNEDSDAERKIKHATFRELVEAAKAIETTSDT